MATTKTILQVIPRLDTGGAELSTVEITAAIVGAGGRALVATEGGRLGADITRLGGELITMSAGTKNPITMIANARRLAAIIKAERVSIIHARSRAPAWSALIAARQTGIPFVTTYHGAYGETNPIKSLYNGVMARGDIVIANSGFTRDLILKRYRTPPEKVRVIHRGVDADAFETSRVNSDRLNVLRHAWAIRPGDRVVLQAARLTGWKGQTDLVEAVQRLRVRSGLVVVLAGDAQGRDDYRHDLERRIKAAGLEGVVRLVGHCADMPAAFALADVSVVASREPEAFGRTATESQAAGCPVIATNIGAPPETVLAAPAAHPRAITGWLVPPSDPVAMAAALEAALALAPEERTRIGERAKAHVRAKFSLAGMQRSTLEIYEELTRLREIPRVRA